jgi:hypothetical protein
MVKETIGKIRTWTLGNSYPNRPREKRQPTDKRIPWTTQFKNIVKLTRKEKDLAPEAAVTFCRPTTLGNHITNYKIIAKQKNQKDEHQGSHLCGRCGLCGGYGSFENMVLQTKVIVLRNGKEIPIRNTINCKDYGIYGAQCNQCMELYIGQTKNSFSKRWSGHRANWNNMVHLKDTKDTGKEEDQWNDENALFLHYRKKHRSWLTNNTRLSDAYKVVFIEKPNAKNLDVRESMWIGKVQATINIAKTYLPKYK